MDRDSALAGLREAPLSRIGLERCNLEGWKAVSGWVREARKSLAGPDCALQRHGRQHMLQG
jgi:hypothetical protein